MKARRLFMMLVTSSLLLVTAVAQAQVPPVINYQGQLLDASGNPANGNFAMVFAIFDVPTGGTALYTETQNVTVSNGVFNALIGSATPIPQTLFDGSTNRLLEITVNGTVLTPRRPFGSVPYAFASRNSGGSSPWLTSGNNVYYNNGNVGIGTNSPTALLHSQSTGNIPSFLAGGSSADFAVPNNNQAMQFGSWDGASAFTEWMRISSAGNVGIGTTNPNVKLDVAGAVDIAPSANGRALDVISSGFTTGQLMNLETTSIPGAAQDMLQIRAPAGAPNNMQFIECHRVGDLEFAVNGDGNVFADGSYTGPADFSEMIEVSSGALSVEAGDVLVIDPNSARSVAKSSQPRSTLVAGIYSTKPGFVGMERDWDKSSNAAIATYTLADMAENFNEIPLAVVGIVPCKVSAENGAIRPGDLLVTSSTAGHAMRDEAPQNGTVVGKALGSLNSGTGVIKVLVTLQ